MMTVQRRNKSGYGFWMVRSRRIGAWTPHFFACASLLLLDKPLDTAQKGCDGAVFYPINKK